MKYVEIKKNEEGEIRELEIRGIKVIIFDLFTNYIYFYTDDTKIAYKLNLEYFFDGSTFFRKLYNIEKYVHIEPYYETFGFNFGFTINFKKKEFTLYINRDGTMSLCNI